MKGNGSRASRDFSKAWNRDAHLPKLDPRLLPALQKRWWTAAELTDYCREKRHNHLLKTSLVERWLFSAEERGLTRRREGGDSAVEGRWEVTDHGRARVSFIAGLFQTVGGLSGTLGVASFLIALSADHISNRFRPIAIVAIAYLVCLIGGLIAGRVLAERSRVLLRKVVERERLVQASNQPEVAPGLDT